MTFDEYCTKFEKNYAGAERERRRELYEKRAAENDAFNAQPGATWMAGPSPLTDLYPHEMQTRFGHNKAMENSEDPARGPQLSPLHGLLPGEQLPTEVDWRKHQPNVITTVRDQGGCGSCWAITAAQTIESHVALATGHLLDLSPQQLNACTENPRNCGGSGGCSGATAALAYNYTISQGGLATVWDAPYISGLSGMKGDCSLWYTAAASITGYVVLPMNDAKELMIAVAKVGPVAVSVDASKWYRYQSGIFDGCAKHYPVINHAVQLVGYGQENGVKYWLLRNSWSTRFGEHGYIRLKRYDDGQEPCGRDTNPQVGSWCEGGPSEVRVCGECGILSDSSYPTGAAIIGGRHLQAADVLV